MSSREVQRVGSVAPRRASAGGTSSGLEAAPGAVLRGAKWQVPSRPMSVCGLSSITASSSTLHCLALSFLPELGLGVLVWRTRIP